MTRPFFDRQRGPCVGDGASLRATCDAFWLATGLSGVHLVELREVGDELVAYEAVDEAKAVTGSAGRPEVPDVAATPVDPFL